ncbi:MAG: hypothetical protein DLM72_09995 [Candidatus Nitrosopolaris wilkensis]|nr:MAG: hypothetical protein DLM72_09995 [Candidatus Nitrosopolaris wilkensis]
MAHLNGKWHVYELNTNEGHMCIKRASKVTPIVKDEKPPVRHSMTETKAANVLSKDLVKPELTEEVRNNS